MPKSNRRRPFYARRAHERSQGFQSLERANKKTNRPDGRTNDDMKAASARPGGGCVGQSLPVAEATGYVRAPSGRKQSRRSKRCQDDF